MCYLNGIRFTCRAETGMGDPLRTYIDALRVLAKTHDPNRIVLIKRNIDRYLGMESGGKERGLERLRVAIHNEETERREGEDWRVAEGLRSITAAQDDVNR